MIQAKFLPLILCFIIISNLSIMLVKNAKKLPQMFKRIIILLSMVIAIVSVGFLLLYIFE